VTRYIEISLAGAIATPERLELRVGDLLKFSSTGGRVVAGSDVVEMLGVFTSATLTTAGTILSPQGPPNVVVFRAVRQGRASIELMVGDPWHSSSPIALSLHVG